MMRSWGCSTHAAAGRAADGLLFSVQCMRPRPAAACHLLGALFLRSPATRRLLACVQLWPLQHSGRRVVAAR
jgi:hypothetical protein